MSKLLHDIRRAELVRREVEREREQRKGPADEPIAYGATPLPPDPLDGASDPPTQGFTAPPEEARVRTTPEAERRALAAARARKAAESAGAAQASARAEADRNAARIAMQRAEMERQATLRAQSRIAANTRAM